MRCDKTVRLRRVANGQCAATLWQDGQARSVAFSPDGGTLAAGLNTGSVVLWTVASSQQAATLTGHTRCINSVAFARGGAVLITGSDDKTARVWDVASGRCAATLEGHTGYVSSVAASPDGRTLATGSDDGTARLWA